MDRSMDFHLSMTTNQMTCQLTLSPRRSIAGPPAEFRARPAAASPTDQPMQDQTVSAYRFFKPRLIQRSGTRVFRHTPMPVAGICSGAGSRSFSALLPNQRSLVLTGALLLATQNLLKLDPPISGVTGSPESFSRKRSPGSSLVVSLTEITICSSPFRRMTS